jgi:hypothetical protein
LPVPPSICLSERLNSIPSASKHRLTSDLFSRLQIAQTKGAVDVIHAIAGDI